MSDINWTNNRSEVRIDKTGTYGDCSIRLATSTDEEGDNYIRFEVRKQGFSFVGSAPNEPKATQRAQEVAHLIASWKQWS